MRMVCERHRCEMDVKACLARQKKYDNNVAFNVVNRDPGCADCAQGKSIRQQVKGKKMTSTAVKIDTPAAGKAAGMDVAAELDALEAAARKRKASDQPVDQHGIAAASATAEPALKRCPKCERYLPADLDHFYEDIRGKMNLSCWCKECQRARGRARKKEQREAKRQEKQQAEAAAASDESKPWVVPAKDVPEIEPEWTRPRPRRTVTLDFTDRPKMLDRIEKAAAREFRTPEQEILFWASLGLRGAEKIMAEQEQTDESPWWAEEETA